jgi:acetate kinase
MVRMSARMPAGRNVLEPRRSSINLALNSGSSSLKFGLYRVDQSRTELLISGAAESIGDREGRFSVQMPGSNSPLRRVSGIPDQSHALISIIEALAEFKLPAPESVGHRVVHGGPALRRHCIIDDSVLAKIQCAESFAPLHIPTALAVMRAAREHFPGVPHVACLDTAFHAQMSQVARTLPLPEELRSQGIERYGFHGLSCESIVRQLGASLPQRLIVAHLGNGASITAVEDGISVDTSMGLTPTGGVIMGTRSGDLDPGLMIYLMREKKFDAAMIEDLMNHRAGLLGISGLSSDMRSLRSRAPTDEGALLAIQMFCYSVRKQLAAMIAALGGVDTIVFTGGIGENDSQTRSLICSCLSWMGVELEQIRNTSAVNPISSSTSRCSVLVLPSEEDEQIALDSVALLD